MNKRTDILSIEEAKEVLVFLRVEKEVVNNINNFDVLVDMISEREAEMIEELGVKDALKFKEIFNTFKTEEERYVELKKLYNYIK